MYDEIARQALCDFDIIGIKRESHAWDFTEIMM